MQFISRGKMKKLLFLTFLVIVSIAAIKIDTRKIALAQENLPSGWAFESKGASIKSTSRTFVDAAGNKIIVSVVKHKSVSSAKFKFGQEKGFYESSDATIARPAPLRQVDDYYAFFVNGNITSYAVRKGDLTFSFNYWGTPPSTNLLLQCETLQLDRLLQPNKSGLCGIQPKGK
jgi:hypothetical protein